ncbi:hypothetical protein HMH01_11440 [Halovulum dunhuangense]|uniref:Uncharacterized protein n=1 Tax=Halovulum dunhuangense TaxID=1505036 RepID=A0A849L4H7_9RHOB|nr:hypothetical protein [Halovulum dunhuangense]NNU81051.1 hypothetical protein [Halovulum dunhuangense]
MNLQRVLENLSSLSRQGAIPQGVIDEGRIFALGQFENDDDLHGRVNNVVEGLKDHVGQPFDTHPWAFLFDLSTFKQDGIAVPMTLLGAVWPQDDGTVFVRDFFVMPRGLRRMNDFLFEHTANGTNIKLLGASKWQSDVTDRVASSLYPLAIAILNTRGCSIDFKSAPSVINARRKRQGKPPIPARYEVDAAEYITALRSTPLSSDHGGTHASPIPHLRRAHERMLASGKRIWVRSALINVRSEGDIAFVERRKAYRGREGKIKTDS